MTKDVAISIRKRGEEIKNEIISWRRSLHAIPELRMDTPKTEAEIVRILSEIGVDEVRAGVGGHGVTAVIKGELSGGCLAIRADCDGLPIKEETGLPFASDNGNMHACGHDAHTAMALGAAKLLAESRASLKGSVKLIFQPFEEGDGGAKLMLADGALDGVDAIVALHNNPTPDADYELGDVLVTDEPITANIYAYEATFHGTTSHVCLSATAKNPIYMACRAVSEISAIDAGSDGICAVTVVNGGVRNNIIPEACKISGTVRAFDTEKHRQMKERVFAIIKEAAEHFGGSVDIETSIDVMATNINRDLYGRFCDTVSAVYPEREPVRLKERELIGEDFARFAERVPGLYFKLHTAPDGTSYPLHHPKFDINESALHKGSVLFAAFAFSWQEG